MGGQGDWGTGSGEEEAQLVGEEVAAQWGAGNAFFQDETVGDRGYGDVGGADVDYEGRGFAGGEAIWV